MVAGWVELSEEPNIKTNKLYVINFDNKLLAAISYFDVDGDLLTLVLGNAKCFPAILYWF
ncbi:hypothetical protein NIES4071_43020 [Calothrix sp. NIES-4071]|nr:hypothetical protein NIES4071_43020 [Calothrix sp. NIES-4071]BAZ58616.1 hypothetical protein NIES4105_42950 [Calothrix sp. NIES-4105]